MNLNQLLQYIFSHAFFIKIALIAFAVTLLTLLEQYAFKMLCPKLIARAKAWDESLILAAHRPLIFSIWATGLILAYRVIIESYPHLNMVDASQMAKFSLIISLAWFALSFINHIEKKLIKQKRKLEFNSDLTTIIAISQIARFAVISSLSLVFLQNAGISISAILAFGGVGAITVGFAAKDTLANLLGGMMIFIDRPFSVGDFIKSPDNQIEGTVEDIGWRLTQIRDTEMNTRYVPNSLFSSIPLINLSRINNRRIKTTVKLRFQDLDEIKPIVEEIKSLLKSHPDIDQTETIAVSFEDIGEYSLNLLILAFTSVTDWVRYLEIQQEVLLKILKIVHKHNAEYALPVSGYFTTPNKIHKKREAHAYN